MHKPTNSGGPIGCVKIINKLEQILSLVGYCLSLAVRSLAREVFPDASHVESVLGVTEPTFILGIIPAHPKPEKYNDVNMNTVKKRAANEDDA